MKKGDTFTHASFVRDMVSRRPAIMKITKVTKTAVYYTYADADNNKGLWFLDRDVFEERYGS